MLKITPKVILAGGVSYTKAFDGSPLQSSDSAKEKYYSDNNAKDFLAAFKNLLDGATQVNIKMNTYDERTVTP